MRHISAIAAMATVTSILFFSGCDKPKPKELDNEQVAVNFAREVLRGRYHIVKTEELKGWMDSKKEMLIVDTMPYDESYKKNHIPGAMQILFVIPEMEKIEKAKEGELLKLLGDDKERTVIFYCGFTKCTRSHNAAMWAVKLGYKNVYRYPAGIVGWKEAGYPVQKI